MPNQRNPRLVCGLLLLLALSFRVAVARLLPNDTPLDGKVYAQIARNILEQHVYSHASEPPYDPSLIRLPGYPLFLAGIYSLFGHSNNTAVRITQALIDSGACSLVGLLAFCWEPNEQRKRSASIAALALAAVCPFSVIYVATLLTETTTMFLSLAICFIATMAFKAGSIRCSILLWIATGLISGLAVLFRPDSGLFAAAIGLTLVITILFSPKDEIENSRWPEIRRRLSTALLLGAAFSIAFCLVLLPWTIRNKRIFNLFQPLAPAHAEMPGEFVPRGYLAWLRTWLDDERYIAPMLWSLDELPVKLEYIPGRAFDSAEEKARVAMLLEKYNHPPQEEAGAEPSTETKSPSSSVPSKEQPDSESQVAAEPRPSNEESDEVEKEEEGDQSDEGETPDANVQQEEQQPVQMTPEIDAAFAEIARQRIARSPLRYYLRLPVRRAINLWFNTHSQYYPFEGELLPLEDLDYDIHQQFWLPLFVGLVCVYTLLGIAGGGLLWSSGQFEARRWLLLAALVILLRLCFFSTIENPEPRYVVELFPFLAILGGIAVSRLIDLIGSHLRSKEPASS